MDKQEGSGTIRVSAPIAKRQRKPARKLVREICKRYKELGWREDFIDEFFKEYTDWHFKMEDTEHYVEEYIEYFYSQARKQNNRTFNQLLYRMGFAQNVIEQLWSLLEPLHRTEYSDDQLVELAIEYIFGRIDPITDEHTPYCIPLQEENALVYKRQYKGYVMNYNPQAMKPKAVIVLLKQYQDTDEQFYFHCTCWKHALNILDIGPKYYEGKKCRDFGIKPSFYTTTNIQMAFEWGKMHQAVWSNEVAIVVFKFDPKALHDFKSKHFNKTTEEWQTLVKHSRKCIGRLNELDTCDFVYGPVCKNQKQVREQDAVPRAFSNKYQLAAKSDKADAFMKQHLWGTIFFRKD